MSKQKSSQPTLVVNGYNSTHGGGLRIFHGLVRFLGNLPKDGPSSSPVILFSPRHDVSLINEARELGLNAVVYCPTKIRALDQIILYFIYLPARALAARNSESLINLGDYIVPFARRQLYYFDWPYAVTDASDVWKQMTLRQRVGRWIKRINIRTLIGTPKVVTVQSQFVADEMTRALKCKAPVIIPCPVEPAQPITAQPKSAGEGATPTHRFFCPSSFATHKNITILPQVAKILKEKKIPAQIIVTLNQAADDARAFLDEIQAQGLSEVIVNVGTLNFEEIDNWFAHCDALLFPTKLETFGLPYVESLARFRPILTSDLPFAHEICKTGAMFFDPDDPSDIAAIIEEFINSGGLQIDEAKVKKIVDDCHPGRVYSQICSLAYF